MSSSGISAHIVLVAVCVLGPSACSGADAGGPALVRAVTDPASPAFGSVEIAGLDGSLMRTLRTADLESAEWEPILAVYTGAAAAADVQPMLGSYAVTEAGIRFTPRFRPVAGQPYRVRFDPSGIEASTGIELRARSSGAVRLDTTLVFGDPESTGAPRASVVHVHPTSEDVPVNLLRLYITFSEPMSVGEAYSRIHLLDAHGQEIEDAFLVVPQELWDPEHTRLTVLFDPGRIKRGLRPNEEAGLPLRVGQTYSLVIDSLWKDGAGRAMARTYRRVFSVTGADRALPRVADWRVRAPAAGTLEPVELRFPEPLDFALLHRLIRVRRANGEEMTGTINVTDQERRWTFTPPSPWAAGDYSLIIGTELEDIAGNSLRRIFDTDPGDPVQGETGAMVDLPFTVAGSSG